MTQVRRKKHHHHSSQPQIANIIKVILIAFSILLFALFLFLADTFPQCRAEQRRKNIQQQEQEQEQQQQQKGTATDQQQQKKQQQEVAKSPAQVLAQQKQQNAQQLRSKRSLVDKKVDAADHGREQEEKQKPGGHGNEEHVVTGPNKRVGNGDEPVLFEMELGNLKNTDGTTTTTGKVIIELKPEWAPLGAQRFRELIQQQFFDDNYFFRVVPNFIVQFGINGNPQIQQYWRKTKNPIQDDPIGKQTNSRGTITFATSGKNTRTTQLFINTSKRPNGNAYLDKEGFTPFALIVDGMEYIDMINDEYREKPNQGKIVSQGNEYLNEEFPRLSYISSFRELTTTTTSGSSSNNSNSASNGSGDHNSPDNEKGDGKQQKEHLQGPGRR